MPVAGFAVRGYLKFSVASLLPVMCALLMRCTPSAPPSPPPPPPPPVDAGPCTVADALTQGRMIRDPQTGNAKIVPCPVPSLPMQKAP